MLTLDVFRDVPFRQIRSLSIVFDGIIRRCYDKTYSAFAYYGGRGITVCDQWKENRFLFIAWAVSEGYEPGLTIDRIDGDKEYSPQNCRFATRAQQRTNRKPRGFGKTHGGPGKNRFMLKKSNNASRFVGVYSSGKKWRAGIKINRRWRHIGTFDDEESAARAYDATALEAFGENAIQNFTAPIE